MGTPPSGISRAGRPAELLFFELVPDARPTKSSALGDALVDDHPVEIKLITSGVTINQVRAVKYIPLIVHDVPRRDWYVVPPQVVVALVSKKSRGQHTENPFESATLGLKSVREYRLPDMKELRREILKAVRTGEQYPRTRAAMNEVLDASRVLAAESLSKVRRVLQAEGLAP